MDRKLLDQVQDGDPIAVALRGGAGWIHGRVAAGGCDAPGGDPGEPPRTDALRADLPQRRKRPRRPAGDRAADPRGQEDRIRSRELRLAGHHRDLSPDFDLSRDALAPLRPVSPACPRAADAVLAARFHSLARFFWCMDGRAVRAASDRTRGRAMMTKTPYTSGTRERLIER